MRSRTAVSSSPMLHIMPMSPTTDIIGCFGRASFAPFAYGRLYMIQIRITADDSVLERAGDEKDVRAERDDDVGLGHGAVSARPAVAAERPERERVRRGKSVRVVLQRSDRDAGRFGERLK